MKSAFGLVESSLYGNAMTFLRQPLAKPPIEDSVDIVVLGFPFDLATTGRSGARMGPTAIRQASTNLAWEGKKFPWSFNLLKHCQIVDAGDLVFNAGDAKAFCQQAQRAVEELIANNNTLLSFGGDHFVTLPILRAFHKKFGKMALIHFDAHTDTYDQGGRYDHGTMFYHAPKEGLIDPEHSIQIGIRTNYNRKKHAFSVVNAMQANDWSVDEIVSTIKQRVGDLPVYLTFDIDCLDPAYAPGTGTPVIGGLTTDKVLKIIRALNGIHLVGMDVVEVAPSYDSGDITALAGATIGLELMYLWASFHKSVNK